MGKKFSILFEILFTSLHLYCGIWGHSQQPHLHTSVSWGTLSLRWDSIKAAADSRCRHCRQCCHYHSAPSLPPDDICGARNRKLQLYSLPLSTLLWSTSMYPPSVKIYLITVTIHLFVIEDWEMKSILFNCRTDHSPGPADCNWMVKNLKVYISFITHEWWFSASVRCNSTMLNYYEWNVPSIYVLERCSYYEKKLWPWKIPRDRWKEV